MSESMKTNEQKPGPGAPRGNGNARKSGFHAAKAALKTFGSRAINKRIRPGREWKSIYVEFLSEATRIPAAELTRKEQITAAEKTLSKIDVHDIQALASEAFIVRKLDANLIQAGSLVRRDKTSIPLVADRRVAQAAYEEHRAEFRARFQKPKPSLDALRERYRAPERPTIATHSGSPSVVEKSQQGSTSQTFDHEDFPELVKS
jgi:hypothetical protein